MRCPTLKELPPPPPDKTGWPWTEESPQLLDNMPDGTPWPKISIVTPSFNQGQFIEETIRSVFLQGYPDLEYIIIDGGSTDGTIKIIKKYDKWLAYWVSEPDKGQSNAINKGIDRVTGDMFAWINSDDLYCKVALEKVACCYDKRSPCIIAGEVEEFESKHTNQVVQKNITFENVVEFWKENNCQWHQPGIFFPVASPQGCEFVDNYLRYEMDRDVLIRYLLQNSVSYLNKTVAHFRIHEKSKSYQELYRFYIERSRVSRRYWKYLEGGLNHERERGLTDFLLKRGSHQIRHGYFSDGYLLFKEAMSISIGAAVKSILRETRRLFLGGKWTGRF